MHAWQAGVLTGFQLAMKSGPLYNEPIWALTVAY
jgi:translation elongation factor EF-G